MAVMWKKRTAAVLILTGVLVAGIVQDADAQTSAVSIQNYTFTPGSVTVPVGTTLRWTNLDTVAHTVTSDSNAFDSGVLGHNGQFTFQFSQPGTYSYHCQIHAYMTGTIIVTSAGGPPTSAPTRVPTVTPLPTTITPGPTSTAVLSSPTATSTSPGATAITAPTATDTPVPPTPTATPTTASTAPGVLRVSMSGTLRAKHRDTLTVTVANAKSHPVPGAQIRADLSPVGISAIKKLMTDSHGRARMTFTPRKQGEISIRASKHGYRTKTVTARVHG